MFDQNFLLDPKNLNLDIPDIIIDLDSIPLEELLGIAKAICAPFVGHNAMADSVGKTFH
jgi:hypothetical protein